MELLNLFGKITIDNQQANEAIDNTTNKAKDGEKQQSGAFSKIGGAEPTMGSRRGNTR